VTVICKCNQKQSKACRGTFSSKRRRRPHFPPPHDTHRSMHPVTTPHAWAFLLLLSTCWAAVTNMNTPTSPIMPGSVLTINWINDPTTGVNPPKIQLELVSRTSGQIFPIDANVNPDVGVYNWDLPKSIPEGDYYIRMMGGSQPLFTGNFHGEL